MDQIVAAFPGQGKRFYFSAQSAKAAGSYQSLWTTPGFPGPSSTPATGTGAVPVNADGRVRFTNPAGGLFSHLALFRVSAVQAGSIVFYDRLWHNSGLSGTVTTAQTVNSLAITRPDATGEDVELWLEVYTPTGTTAVTVTVSYTNSSGTSGRTGTAALIASPVAGQMIPVVLQAGDTGVASVQSLTLSATTGTAGNFGLTLVRRITTLGVTANTEQDVDVFGLGMPRIYDNACLAFMGLSTTTSVGPILGGLSVIQG